MALNWRSLFSLRRSRPELVAPPRRGISRSAGMVVSEDTSMKVAAFYRGVIYIATQIAKLPWEVKDRDYNVVEDGVSRLLNLSPNPEMDAFFFRLQLIYNAIVHGNAFCEIERNVLGAPIALWPLPSRDVEPWRDERGKLWYRFIGGQTRSGTPVLLEPRDVFHIKNFHTKDGLVGQGVVAYATETLGISLAADQMAAGLFANGGLPSGVLKHKGILSEDAYQRLMVSWKEQYGGRRAGGVAILEEEMDFQPIDVDPQVLQFLESRKFGVLEIARFLGVPPTKLFDITAATYSNVENANLEVATDTLDAWARSLEIQADIKLLNNGYGGKFTEFDISQIFRADMNSRSTYFQKMMQSAAITPNEIRRAEGKPGYPGGDRYYIARNNFAPEDRIDDLIDAEIKSGEAKASPPRDTNETSEEEKELTRAAIKVLTEGR